MGDATAGQVRLSVNSRLRVEFRRATVTFDAELLIGVVVIRLVLLPLGFTVSSG